MSRGAWSYSETAGIGPSRWKDLYPAGAGQSQSPVDVVTEDVAWDEGIGALTFAYGEAGHSTLTNDGRTVQITLINQHQVISGGPLSHQYRLATIRFHWGESDVSGSEHLIDGSGFPLEVQLIHWNHDLYKNMAEAIVGEDGLCIIGLFFQVGEEENIALKPIIDLMSRDEPKGCFSLEVKSAIDLSKLIPETGSFWTYEGSLCTPPLTENVSWILFQETQTLSGHQLETIRKMRNGKGEAMTSNCRPVCPINDRAVRASRMLETSDGHTEEIPGP